MCFVIASLYLETKIPFGLKIIQFIKCHHFCLFIDCGCEQMQLNFLWNMPTPLYVTSISSSIFLPAVAYWHCVTTPQLSSGLQLNKAGPSHEPDEIIICSSLIANMSLGFASSMLRALQLVGVSRQRSARVRYRPVRDCQTSMEADIYSDNVHDS